MYFVSESLLSVICFKSHTCDKWLDKRQCTFKCGISTHGDGDVEGCEPTRQRPHADGGGEGGTMAGRITGGLAPLQHCSLSQ